MDNESESGKDPQESNQNDGGTTANGGRDSSGKFTKGNREGKLITSEKQPTREAKRRGIAKKKIGHDLLRAIVDLKADAGQGSAVLTDICNYFHLDPNTISEEALMHLRMVEKVKKQANIQAYRELMNRLYGLPKQPLEHSGPGGGAIETSNTQTITRVLIIEPPENYTDQT